MEDEIFQGVRGLTLLYQMFWHGLSPARLTNTAPAVDRQTREKNLAVYFSFNCRLDHYRSSPGVTNDFLYELALAIYRRSFPK